MIKKIQADRNAHNFSSHHIYLALSESSLRNSSIKLKGCGDYNYYPLTIGSIYFVGDITHPETKALQNKYRELRGKISEIYNNGDFLEITLSKLTETD